MPRSESPLDELAHKMGISAEFRDAWGSVIRTSTDTERKLLAAMGIEVATPEEARTAIRALDRAAWAQTLAPASNATRSRLGAPPDIYNPAGQDWGLPPFDPRALQEESYWTSSGPDVGTLVRAVHEFLARTNSLIALVQLDDLTDEAEPVNVPGTSSEYPNWRRRNSLTLEELLKRPRFTDIVTVFAAEREVVRAPGREAFASEAPDRPALESTS
jgi:hypothetical protein